MAFKGNGKTSIALAILFLGCLAGCKASNPAPTEPATVSETNSPTPTIYAMPTSSPSELPKSTHTNPPMLELPEYEGLFEAGDLSQFKLYEKRKIILDWDISRSFGELHNAIEDSEESVELYTTLSFFDGRWESEDGRESWILIVRTADGYHHIKDFWDVGGVPKITTFYKDANGDFCVLTEISTKHFLRIEEFWYEKATKLFSPGKVVYETDYIFQIFY